MLRPVLVQIGPVLGDAALRDKVSKALLAAMRKTSDPDALSIIARVRLPAIMLKI